MLMLRADNMSKRKRQCHSHMPFFVVAIRFRRPAAEFFAQKQILQLARHNIVSQRVAVEVRCVLRIRLRTDIDQHINAVLLEQSAEMLGRVIGVANREQRAIDEVQVRHRTVRLKVVWLM